MEGVQCLAVSSSLTPSELALVQAFASCVADFCAFVQQAHTRSLDERLTETQRHLLRLYAGGVTLPDVHDLPDEPEDEATKLALAQASEPPATWAGYESHEYYWETFDPYKDDSLVAGLLSDDVLDIHRDLREGLAWWRATPPQVDRAVWTWKFSFQTHWGSHAIDALRALHTVLTSG
jgi:hypothetical protein